jgi:hypothetical protein
MMHISHLLIVITIVLLYSLYTNASVASTVASPPPSSTSTSSSTSPPTTSIATFGFNTIKGNDILTSLQQYNNNNNIFYIKLSKPSNLITFDKVDTVIVNINDNHYIDDSLLEISSYIIENSIYRGTLTNLLILIDNDNPKLIDKVNNIINDAYNLQGKLNQLLKNDQIIRVVVIGGGYSGVEVATSVSEYLTKRNAVVTILDRNECVMNGSPDHNRATAEKSLLSYGISINVNTDVKKVSQTAVTVLNKITNEEYDIPADIVISTCGVQPNKLIQSLLINKKTT